MSATLTLRRQTYGLELRRGVFDVILDGDSAGSIDHGQTADFELSPGHHTIQVRAGRYSSGLKEFDVSDGSAVTFRCHGAAWWPRYLLSIFVPKLGLSLRHQ